MCCQSEHEMSNFLMQETFPLEGLEAIKRTFAQWEEARWFSGFNMASGVRLPGLTSCLWLVLCSWRKCHAFLSPNFLNYNMKIITVPICGGFKHGSQVIWHDSLHEVGSATPFEWSGLVMFQPTESSENKGHHFQEMVIKGDTASAWLLEHMLLKPRTFVWEIWLPWDQNAGKKASDTKWPWAVHQVTVLLLESS